MARRMGMVNLNGQMVQPMKDNSLTITFMDAEFIFGQIIDAMRVSGKTTRCTEKVSLLGPMEENTKVITMTIRNKVEEFSPGLMEENMMASGTMESNMEKAFITLPKEKLREENGKRVRE